MKTVYETSAMSGNAHVSCIKYRYLNNVSHYHSDHELIYVIEGCASVNINEKFFNLGPGECVFIHSSDIHYIHSDENTVATVLKAKSKHFENIFASKRLTFPLINIAAEVGGLLSEIYSELKLGEDSGELMADCLTAQLFIKILRSGQTAVAESTDPNKAATNELYSEISRKISDEYSTITFKEAAEYMHFSEPYFSKVFRNIFGMTFTRYLNTVKIAAAIKKLKEGNMSITEISAGCGFNTIRNFNRVFRNFTGYSPKNIPPDYVFLYSLRDGHGLDPTLNCTEILE